MKKCASILILCIVLLTTVSAAKIEGNQRYVNRFLKVSDFFEVNVMSNFNVIYHQNSDSAGHIVIYGEENIVKDIKVESKKGCLDLRFNNTAKREFGVVIINIYSSGINKVECDNNSTFETRGVISGQNISFSLIGNGQIKTSDLKFLNIKAKIMGSGDMLLKGQSDDATLSIIGGGEIRAHDLQVKQIKCSITGGGNIGCYPKTSLNVTITGSGNVYYNGKPGQMKQRVIGSGKVLPLVGERLK